MMRGGLSSSSKRKTPTPRAKTETGEDVWYRVIKESKLLNKSESLNMATAEGISPSNPDPSLAQGSDKKRTIFDLPLETQKEIFKFSNTTDLVSLALVSKHFRDIATEHLYRTFHIIFPDEEDPSNDVPIDGLAGGLDTFVSSDYDYTKHLREIVLESLSGGAKGERAYRHYQYDVSCGKFMNTLLLLTLRKAKALETFKWDIRVENSREVFKALHGIKSLRNLHLRMHQGRSIFQVPPPIHGSPTTDSIASPTLAQLTSKSYALQSKLASRKVPKNDFDGSSSRVPPTLSGFQGLSSLAILDMDTLEYASELKFCISNSISTLSSLKLSFSDALSNQSRQPPPDAVSDEDSDQEDEFQVGLPPGMPPAPGQTSTGSGSTDQNGASKAVSSMEQKKNQEVFLAKIFGIEPPTSTTKSSTPPGNDPIETLSILELRSKFLKTLSPIFSKLFASVKDAGTAGPAEADVFEIMRKFTEIEDAFSKSKDSKSLEEASGTPNSTKTTDDQSLEQAAGTSDGGTSKETPESSVDSKTNEAGLFDTATSQKANIKAGVSDPDDFDVNEPETKDLSLDTELPGDPEDTKTKLETAPEKPPGDINEARSKVLKKQAQLINMVEEIRYNVTLLKTRYMKLQINFDAGISTANPYAAIEVKAAEDLYVSRQAILDGVESNLREIGAEVDAITNGTSYLNPHPVTIESRDEKMREYVRETRGLSLETLAIYLIPIKASILSKAVDLGHLRSITLLNVGPQTAFWQHMTRQNIASPLPLHKIHTDHVTIAFLSCVAQLDNLTELFLLERTAKTKVETMTVRTTVTMEHIRRLVIKRHAATLKILMIRNDAGQEWDLNIKTAMLLCQRAKALEELAVSFGVRTMHTLLQFMSGLDSLRALHAIKFRTNDQCMWVLQEFRRFTADNLSHHPHLKLEYVAVDGSIDRIIRRVPKTAENKSKGKAKEVASGLKPKDGKTLTQLLSESSINTGTLDPSLLEESEEEHTSEWGVGVSGKMGLKVETVEGLRFYDVTSVKIFEKEILRGGL